MKRLFVFVGCIVFFVFVLGGCESPAELKTNSKPDELSAEAAEGFPEFLVGRWKADKYGWEFIFESDGTISWAAIDGGAIKIRPIERVVTLEGKDGAKAVYTLGDWTVQYSANGRELSVEIVVDHFEVDRISYKMEGYSTDLFVGAVSDDWESWEAEWFHFSETTVVGPEVFDFPFDPNNNPIDTLVFKKQVEEK